jgi:hypothetical protein
MVYATRKPGQPSQYGGDIATVRVDFFYETPYRLRVKVVHSFYLVRSYKPLPLSLPPAVALHMHTYPFKSH